MSLAERLANKFDPPADRCADDWEEVAVEALAHLRDKLQREKIAEAISDIYGRLPDGSVYPSNYDMADAVWALIESALAPRPRHE